MSNEPEGDPRAFRIKVQEMLTDYILQDGFAAFCDSRGVTVEKARSALNQMLYQALIYGSGPGASGY